jgi:phosphonopyruvate decarboxylase
MAFPLDADRVFGALADAGVRQVAGVPCSLLEPLQAVAEGRGAYLPAHVEGEAAALAAGSWLAGGQGAVLLQNSGLGNLVNPLASLLLPYRIPAAIVTSWRGEPGRPDAAHHVQMGAATLGLFELFGLAPRILREDTDLARISEDLAAGLAGRRVQALVVPRGALDGPRPARAELLAVASAGHAEGPMRFEGSELPRRLEAVDAFRAAFDDCAVVSTTGYTSRDLARHGPQDRHFYMQGSMGFALAVALGVARVRASRPVCVLDGDGALMMRLGSLATAAALAPASLVHVVLDNGTYGSTGGQPASRGRIDFARVALACGFAHAATCVGREGLRDALRWARGTLGRGPALLHVRISAVESERGDRPGRSPEEIAAAFRGFLTAEPV